MRTMRGSGSRLVGAVALVAAAAITLTGCSAKGERTPTPSPSPSHASLSPSPSASVSPDEAFAKIDLGFLFSNFVLFTGDVTGVMPVIAAKDGLLLVNDTTTSPKIANGVITVWGADVDHACLEYGNSTVTVSQSVGEQQPVSGPCAGDFHAVGQLESPKHSLPGTYRAYQVAPAAGPCFSETDAIFPGTGKRPAWKIVDCSPKKWTWKIVAATIATQADFDAGFGKGYQEEVCGKAWDKAETSGARSFYITFPTDYEWAHGQPGVLCLASWKNAELN